MGNGAQLDFADKRGGEMEEDEDEDEENMLELKQED